MNISLRISEKVMMEIPMISQPEKSLFLKSMVLDLRHYSIDLATPILRGREYILPAGHTIRISFCKEDGCYQFEAVVQDRISDGRAIACRIRQTSPMQRIQRREYYRLNCLVPIRFKIARQKPDGNIAFQEIEAVAHDVSGAGARVFSRTPLPADERFECTLVLDTEQVTVSATILRVEKSPEDRLFEWGIYFDEMDEQVRERIMAFIFKRQRQLRSRGPGLTQEFSNNSRSLPYPERSR